MAPTEYSAHAAITVDGVPLDHALVPSVEQVVVDDHLQLPDMFTITLRDVDRKVLGDSRLKIGSLVDLGGTPVGSSSPEPLITGEVTALEGEYDATGMRIVVRGYDKAHRFQSGRRTETYRNVTDSDIARTVAQRAKVDVGTIDATTVTHDHVSQANLTDWEFLKARAREIGYEMSVSDGRFSFRKPIKSSQGPAEGDYSAHHPLKLVFGGDLLTFHPRVTAAEQVKQVQVRGWDPVRKVAVVGQAQAGTTSATLTNDPGQLGGMFGGDSFVATDRPIADQNEADQTALAIAEQIGSAFAEAVGVARGNPKLRAGTAVSIAGVSREFAGQYTLSHTRHVFDEDGYRTHFTISGRQERSLLGLTSLGASNGTASAGGPPIYGLAVAIVTANDDPEKAGRLKLRFPWLDDQYETDWARMAQAGAGPDSGAVFIPEVNDEVLVAFEFGDVRRPYVLGGLYNGVDKPRLGDGLFDNGKVKRRGFVSRKGHRLVFFDDRGTSGIAFLSSDGKLRLSLNETTGEIRIFGDPKVTIEAKSINLKGEKDITLQAPKIAIKADSTVDIDGGTITLN
jgi:phage protein D